MRTKTIRIVDSGLGELFDPKSASIIHLFTMAIVCALFVFSPRQVQAQNNTKEYQIKMAFIVNLVKFVEWPDKSIDPNQPFVIAIIGDVPIKEGQQSIPDMRIMQKSVVMQVFHRWDPNVNQQATLLDSCQTLFIAKSERAHTATILDSVKLRSVMTVGEHPNFLNAGGIFNFEVEKNKVRFSVDMKNAKAAKLSIRSKLLRLAKHVYK